MITDELVVVIESVEEDCSCHVQTLLAFIFDREVEVIVYSVAGGEEEGELKVGGDAGESQSHNQVVGLRRGISTGEGKSLLETGIECP